MGHYIARDLESAMTLEFSSISNRLRSFVLPFPTWMLQFEYHLAYHALVPKREKCRILSDKGKGVLMLRDRLYRRTVALCCSIVTVVTKRSHADSLNRCKLSPDMEKKSVGTEFQYEELCFSNESTAAGGCREKERHFRSIASVV